MNKTIKILRFLAVLVISAGASGMEEFFDDLHYSGSADSLLKARSWHIADGKSGPPAGAFYSAAQITFSADPQNPENRIMYLAAGTEGPEESWRLARIETDLLFHEGTYAARVYFDNKLRKDRGGRSCVRTPCSCPCRAGICCCFRSTAETACAIISTDPDSPWRSIE